MSNISNEYVGYHYDECYLTSTDLNYAGVDNISEYYFLCRDTYKAASDKMLELHNAHMESLSMGVVSCIEDPVLLSPKHKYAIYMREEFGHFILNTVLNIAVLHREDPDAVFIIFTGAYEKLNKNWSGSHQDKLITFLVKFFLNNGINYYIVPSQNITYNFSVINNTSGVYREYDLIPFDERVSNYLIYKAKNITTINSGDTTLRLTVKDIKDLIKDYILDFSKDENQGRRKVYITRGNNKSEPEPFVKNEDSSIGYKEDDIRIYDEELLEKYLKSQGFEIVNFNTLSSIQEQIDFMHSTSVLVGSTGTGLVNELFMKDNRTLIELRVEHGCENRSHRIVPDYYNLSCGKQHLYFGIDVLDKQATTAIKKLDQLFKNMDLNGLIENKITGESH